MPDFNAREIEQWTAGQWRAGRPAAIKGVSTDSRTLCRGALFVALRGPSFDGHAFVAQARARGAAGAVVAEDIGVASLGSFPLLRVADTARALQDMATHYRRRLRLAIVAVTGSVGKTTVKEMTADVLARRLAVARTRGNWNNAIGLPLSLLSVEPEAQAGVFEIGMNRPGELAGLCRILQPDWGLVTTIGPVHLEFFNSVQAIAVEKSALLESLPPDGTAVLRCDEPYFDVLRAAAPGRVITLALNGVADYSISPAPASGRIEIHERATGESCLVRAPLPGPHHAVNALFAAVVGRAQGLAWEDIRCALEKYRSLPMRWEQQALFGITIINDAYNANPVSMAAALRAFTGMPVERGRWLLLAGMLELGSAQERLHRELGSSLAAEPWAGIVTVGELGAIIAGEAVRAGVSSARVFPCADHSAAAEVLARLLRPGDAVLVKASRGQHLEKVLALWKERASA